MRYTLVLNTLTHFWIITLQACVINWPDLGIVIMKEPGENEAQPTPFQKTQWRTFSLANTQTAKHKGLRLLLQCAHGGPNPSSLRHTLCHEENRKLVRLLGVWTSLRLSPDLALPSSPLMGILRMCNQLYVYYFFEWAPCLVGASISRREWNEKSKPKLVLSFMGSKRAFDDINLLFFRNADSWNRSWNHFIPFGQNLLAVWETFLCPVEQSVFHRNENILQRAPI